MAKDDYPSQVATGHALHWIATILAALYGWQLHGWMIGLAVFVGLLAIIAICNLVIMAMAPERLFVWLRVNRWFWVVATFVALALTSASTEPV